MLGFKKPRLMLCCVHGLAGDLVELEQEIRTYSKLSHPNIVAYKVWQAAGLTSCLFGRLVIADWCCRRLASRD